MYYDPQLWLDRLFEDESLGGNLTDDERDRLLAWGERRLMACDSDEQAERVVKSMRRIDRLVARGGRFSLIDRLVLSSSLDPHR